MEKQITCSVFSLTDTMGKKWTIPLIQQIYLNQNNGFNFLKGRMDISSKILSTRLKELETEGLVERRLKEKQSKGVEYSLTKKGIELKEIIDNLKDWTMKYSHEKRDCRDIECIKCDLFLSI